MEENFTPENVRDRLILAGLKELDKHGVIDFSLRRVAMEAGVSCAAPYRHFRDKDELISAILEYFMEGWTLLSGQIGELYSEDARGLITELAVAGLRFFIANGNFRTVITAANQFSDVQTHSGMAGFEEPIKTAIRKLCREKNAPDTDDLIFRVISMLYGAITLVNGGYENFDEAAVRLRAAVSDILTHY